MWSLRRTGDPASPTSTASRIDPAAPCAGAAAIGCRGRFDGAQCPRSRASMPSMSTPGALESPARCRRPVAARRSSPSERVWAGGRGRGPGPLPGFQKPTDSDAETRATPRPACAQMGVGPPLVGDPAAVVRAGPHCRSRLIAPQRRLCLQTCGHWPAKRAGWAAVCAPEGAAGDRCRRLSAWLDRLAPRTGRGGPGGVLRTAGGSQADAWLDRANSPPGPAPLDPGRAAQGAVAVLAESRQRLPGRSQDAIA